MAKKRKKKFISRKIPVVKIDEKREDQVKSPQEFQPAISKIYSDEKGKSLDLTKLDKKKRSRRVIYLRIIGGLLILFIISLAGFFIFFGNKKFKEGDVKLEIESQKSISSGDEVSYTISYLNQGKAFLGNLELSVSYPEGFSFVSAKPEPDNIYNQYWDLGKLSSGKGGQVIITGQVIGEVDSTKVISVKLSYKPSNFNSIFESSTSFSQIISSSIIALEIEGAKKVIPDKETTYKIKYKNESKKALEKIRIEAVYPSEFTYVSSNPEPSEDKTLWQIDRLEASGEAEIELKGKFSGGAGDLRELKIKVGIMGEDNTFKPQVEKSLLILLISPEITLDLIINGLKEGSAVSFSETLTYLIKYKNNSELVVDDFEIYIEINSELIDWTSLDDDLEGKSGENKITWSKDQIEKFVSLKPAEEGEISFKVKTKDQAEILGSDDKNFQIENIAKGFSSSIKDLGGSGIEVMSNEIILKLNTQIMLTCEARYYSEENEKLGSGPLPPEIGKTTTYRIFWYITNSTNEADEVIVTSTLPEDIFWTGKNKSVTAGSLTFDPTTRVITWSVNKMPVGTGQIFPNLKATFEVSATPTENDLGLVKVLTDKASLSATDDFTEAKLNSNCDSLTTELTNDLYAQGKGIVVSLQD